MPIEKLLHEDERKYAFFTFQCDVVKLQLQTFLQLSFVLYTLLCSHSVPSSFRLHRQDCVSGCYLKVPSGPERFMNKEALTDMLGYWYHFVNFVVKGGFAELKK